MKVTPEHLERLRRHIAPLDTPERRAQYAAGNFPRAEDVKDVDTRYRWDLLWHAVSLGHSLPDSTNGYNTAHLDTALRAIVPPIEVASDA